MDWHARNPAYLPACLDHRLFFLFENPSCGLTKKDFLGYEGLAIQRSKIVSLRVHPYGYQGSVLGGYCPVGLAAW